jgi:hypothetical protein
VRPPDDKKDTPVSRKSSKRHISARDFRLPKPYYRMPVANQTRPARSRPRMVLLAFSGLLVAGLIAALALITHENVTSPHPLAVADDKPAPRVPAAPRPVTPAAANRNHVAPLAPGASAPPAVSDDPPAASAPLERPVTMEELPDDPDVDLIATILLLTPGHTDAVPPCAAPPAAGCSANAAPDP